MAAASAKEFEAAVARLQSVGGTLVEVDFSPFAEVAAMLYQSSFVAERYSGVRTFLDQGQPGLEAAASGGGGPAGALAQQSALNGDDRLLSVTRAIISGSGAQIMGQSARSFHFSHDSGFLSFAQLNFVSQTSQTQMSGRGKLCFNHPSPPACT